MLLVGVAYCWWVLRAAGECCLLLLWGVQVCGVMLWKNGDLETHRARLSTIVSNAKLSKHLTAEGK